MRTAASKLSRELRRNRAKRVVIVSHSDARGTCRYNDQLGLRRAAAVRQALIGAGIDRATIRIASLGERRPIDFTISEAARDLNRRVDTLIEPQNPESK